jgi:hypothetical protein
VLYYREQCCVISVRSWSNFVVLHVVNNEFFLRKGFHLFTQYKAQKMDKAIENVGKPLVKFADDSVKLLRKCNKPDRKGKSSLPFFRPIYYYYALAIL